MRGMMMDETPRPKTKVVVHTKSGQKLAHYENATHSATKDAWRSWLSKSGQAVSFGNFAIAVDNIDYVQVVPN